MYILHIYISLSLSISLYIYIYVCIYVCIYIYIYIDRAGSSIVPTACLRRAYALQYVAYASLRGQKVQRSLQKTAYAARVSEFQIRGSSKEIGNSGFGHLWIL